MARILCVVMGLVMLVSAGVQTQTPQFPPGFVDPAPLLAAAAKEIGEANFKCVTFSGAGYSGAVGQTYEHAVNVDWPRIDSDGQLHADHQLGSRHQQGNLRSQARTESGVVEVRPRLGRTDADAEEPAADAHHQRQVLLVDRRRRAAGGGCRPRTPSAISWTSG